MNPPLIADTQASELPEVAAHVVLTEAARNGQARCAGLTDLFFTPDQETPRARRRREAEARAVCATCPVQAACREVGRVNREIGVWGGESDEQRAAAGFPPRNLSRRSVIRAARRARDTAASREAAAAGGSVTSPEAGTPS